MDSFITDDDQLIVQSDAVMKNCLDQLSSLQTRVTDYKDIQSLSFPNLPEPTFNEITAF